MAPFIQMTHRHGAKILGRMYRRLIGRGQQDVTEPTLLPGNIIFALGDTAVHREPVMMLVQPDNPLCVFPVRGCGRPVVGVAHAGAMKIFAVSEDGAHEEIIVPHYIVDAGDTVTLELNSPSDALVDALPPRVVAQLLFLDLVAASEVLQ